MRIALITTTINTPKVLATYRAIDSSVKFFVAGDKNTPQAAYDFCDSIPDCTAGRVTSQIGWKCSDLIGWQCIQRKNIALLEALRWGADIVLTTDDDNNPLDKLFFSDLRLLFEYGFTGLEVSSPSGWFDPGYLLTPTVRHRGIPPGVLTIPPEIRSASNQKIGVIAGLWVGDADVDATHRLAIPPNVHSASAMAQSGVVLAEDTQAVFNAQNVAFRRELAPALFLCPGLGRSDDIFASLIAQRIMREQGLRLHYGKPFTACWQDRSIESVLDDLRDEQYGMNNVGWFADWLDDYEFDTTDRTPLSQAREIYRVLKQSCGKWPEQSSVIAAAFFDDLESVL